MDGEVYEFGKGSGGGKVPVLNQDFTYTGECNIIDDSDNNWRIKFLTSGTFVWLSDSITIDCFLVGGGGAGGTGQKSLMPATGGGGGGYTNSINSVYLSINNSYQIIIGDGGLVGTFSQANVATDGGSTSGFTLTANGGKHGNTARTNYCTGGDGGSGGGGCYAGVQTTYSPNNGGYNGSDGISTSSSWSRGPGKGQGTTTKEFSEETGTLYAGGGGGYYLSANTPGSGGQGGGGAGGSSGTANTGGGGGGNADGGSGIVIIRNHRE